MEVIMQSGVDGYPIVSTFKINILQNQPLTIFSQATHCKITQTRSPSPLRYLDGRSLRESDSNLTNRSHNESKSQRIEVITNQSQSLLQSPETSKSVDPIYHHSRAMSHIRSRPSKQQQTTHQQTALSRTKSKSRTSFFHISPVHGYLSFFFYPPSQYYSFTRGVPVRLHHQRPGFSNHHVASFVKKDPQRATQADSKAAPSGAAQQILRRLQNRPQPPLGLLELGLFCVYSLFRNPQIHGHPHLPGQIGGS